MASFGVWRTDSSEQLLVNENSVSHNGKKGKANAMFTGASGVGYFEFEIHGSSGMWIGICPEDKFGESYKIKGIFYGGPGNLADGGGLIIGQWGPEFAEGDVIGMLVELENNSLKISYSKNGQGLGVAYNVADWNIHTFHPAVSLEQEGQSVTIRRVTDNIPDTSKMQPSQIPAPGLEGKWKGNYHVHIKQTKPDEFQLHAKVANNLRCAFKLNPGANTVQSVSPVASTLMMPDPASQEQENEVKNILTNLKVVKRDGNNLVIEGDGKQQVFEPDLVPSTAARGQVHWLNN